MARSTSETPVVAVDELFPGFGSDGDAELTVAVLLIGPAGVEIVV